MAKKKNASPDNNPFVAITAVTLGIFLVVVILFLLFANKQILFLTYLIWGFVVLGGLATFFAYLAGRKK